MNGGGKDSQEMEMESLATNNPTTKEIDKQGSDAAFGPTTPDQGSKMFQKKRQAPQPPRRVLAPTLPPKTYQTKAQVHYPVTSTPLPKSGSLDSFGYGFNEDNLHYVR